MTAASFFARRQRDRQFISASSLRIFIGYGSSVMAGRDFSPEKRVIYSETAQFSDRMRKIKSPREVYSRLQSRVRPMSRSGARESRGTYHLGKHLPDQMYESLTLSTSASQYNIRRAAAYHLQIDSNCLCWNTADLFCRPHRCSPRRWNERSPGMNFPPRCAGQVDTPLKHRRNGLMRIHLSDFIRPQRAVKFRRSRCAGQE